MTFINNILKQIKSYDSKTIKLLINSNLSLSIKGISLIVSLFTLPAYMRFFQQQQVLGLWFTALSTLSWILMFDLGIGNGLRNYLVKPLVNNDMLEVKRYISSAYFIIGTFVIIVSGIGYFTIKFMNWNIIFNISPSIISNDIMIEVIRMIFIGIMIQFFLRLIISIFFALQNSAVPSLLSLLSSTMLLSFVILAKSGDMTHNFRMLSYVNVISSNLPMLGATIIVFSTRLKKCIPSIKHFSYQYALNIMKLGGIFFWLQIMAMVIFNTNDFLVTWFTSPDKVVEYQIYNKLFGLGAILFDIALIPVWSAITEADAKKDYKWIKKIYNKFNKLIMLVIVGEVFMIFSMQIIVNFWLKDNAIIVNWRYSIIFAVVQIVNILASINSCIANGLRRLKTQLIFLSMGAFLNIPLAYLFVQLTESWIGIVLANIVSVIPYILVQPMTLNRWLGTKIGEQA